MTARFALISGVPRAGKSSLCDAIEKNVAGFTHVPLDRYVLPIPKPLTFLEWLRTPDCIAWEHLREHISVLESGRHCYTPRPDWDGGWGQWISNGGPIDSGPGRRMEPAAVGYLIPGTHSFSFPAKDENVVRIFVETPDSVIAERLIGEPQQAQCVSRLILDRLGTNPEVIKRKAALADFEIDGTASRENQISLFGELFAHYFGIVETVS